MKLTETFMMISSCKEPFGFRDIYKNISTVSELRADGPAPQQAD